MYTLQHRVVYLTSRKGQGSEMRAGRKENERADHHVRGEKKKNELEVSASLGFDGIQFRGVAQHRCGEDHCSENPTTVPSLGSENMKSSAAAVCAK